MSKEMPLLKLKNVSKFYYNKGLVATGFTRISLDFNLGEFVVITGESGSGKSTLLNVLSGLDTYEEGEMYINGEETSHYNESDFEKYRKIYIGNIFQNFNLVNSYTVYQNIELVLLLNGFKKKDIRKKIINIIKDVGLYKFRNTRVSKLSGGQKQRVAIARALAKDTPIIIADEPTGNLDSESAKSIIKLLSDIAKDKLVIVVTHNYDQLEKYATRKIEMHDGKVREDLILKEYQKSEPLLHEYKDIRLTNKILLGVRNTFNIFTKFILMFLVFLFVISAFLGVNALFKKMGEEEQAYGYNEFFRDDSVTRIIIKKKNKTYFSSNDFNKLENIEYISRIEKDDVLLDTMYNLINDDYYLWGKIANINLITKVDVGRMPLKENEIVVKGHINDYYLNNSDKLFEQKLYISNDFGKNIETKEDLKIVGIIFTEGYEDNTFFMSEQVLNKIRLSTNENYSNMKLKIDQNYIKVEKYDAYYHVVANENVPQGYAVFPEELNYLCTNYWCINKKISIEIENIYYKEQLELTISNIYNKNNFKALTSLDNYDVYNGNIFISPQDYNYLYNKYTYQSSVFASDINVVDQLAQQLNNLGYDTLIIRDTIINPSDGIMQVINVFRLVVIIIMFVVLFFITYFVIKLIQRSKNVYYSTVRILGGSKINIKNLISIELYTVYNITFLLFALMIVLSHKGILTFSFLNLIATNLTIREFLIIYLILLFMSMLLSFTYSRKLFKASAMKTYREEV